MINKTQFQAIYKKLPFGNLKVEDYLYGIYETVMKDLINRSNNSPKVNNLDALVLDYVVQEFVYLMQEKNDQEIYEKIKDQKFNIRLSEVLSDKIYFNEINSYQSVSLLSHQSPVISTMELNINFILNRIVTIKEKHPENNLILDMLTKSFLMFRSVNYQLSSGFETEGFSTWRTIHELECVIKVIHDNRYVIPVYRRHIIYNSAFRNEFEDKEEQQKTIDELKQNMKNHGLKSKDMKKYIEYGWLYSINNIEENVEGFKLNFRNGLEAAAGLKNYALDYEMSSEVAHSSPLLVYSNKLFFCSITLVRCYESFLRLEKIFYELLKEYDDIDSSSYYNMRNIYLEFSKNILKKETKDLNKLLE